MPASAMMRTVRCSAPGRRAPSLPVPACALRRRPGLPLTRSVAGGVCARCGRIRRIARRADGEQPDICDGCFRLLTADCARCGRARPCSFASGSEPVCTGCAPRRVSACVRCGQLAPATANWAEGPGLRPLLHGGPAPPRHLRQLPRHPPARRPGRPGRDHLRRLRRTGPPPTCASTAGPRASSTRAAGANGARWPAAPVSCCDPVVASRSPPR